MDDELDMGLSALSLAQSHRASSPAIIIYRRLVWYQLTSASRSKRRWETQIDVYRPATSPTAATRLTHTHTGTHVPAERRHSHQSLFCHHLPISLSIHCHTNIHTEHRREHWTQQGFTSHSTQKTGHFWDVLPSQALGSVLKKLNPTERTQNQNDLS